MNDCRLRCLPLAALTLCLVVPPAHAARECEDSAFVPRPGFCARLENAEIYYRDTHPSTSTRTGLKGTVIFLHAGSGNADAFEHQLDAFARAGYRAVAYDRKNVGRSSNTLRDMEVKRPIGGSIEDLDRLATSLGIERFHLVGVAAGAQVALNYAAWKPDRLLSLVIAATLGTVGGPDGEPEVARFQANVTLPFEVFCSGPVPEGAPDRSVQTVRSIPEVRAEHRELGASFRGRDRAGVSFYNEIEGHSRHRTFDGCRSTPIGPNQPMSSEHTDLTPTTFAKLERIRVRTLALAGGGDILSPPYGMRLWAVHLPNVQWVVMPEAGHAPQLEEPSAFNAHVLRFLGGGTVGPRPAAP